LVFVISGCSSKPKIEYVPVVSECPVINLPYNQIPDKEYNASVDYINGEQVIIFEFNEFIMFSTDFKRAKEQHNSILISIDEFNKLVTYKNIQQSQK